MTHAERRARMDVILLRYTLGETIKSLAREYGLSEQTIRTKAYRSGHKVSIDTTPVIVRELAAAKAEVSRLTTIVQDLSRRLAMGGM